MSKTFLVTAAILVAVTGYASAAIDPAHVANPTLARQSAPTTRTVAWVLPTDRITDNRVIIENRSGAFEDDATGNNDPN